MRDITVAETPPMIPAMFQVRAFLLYSTAASWLPDSSAVLACNNMAKPQTVDPLRKGHNTKYLSTRNKLVSNMSLVLRFH